MIQSISNIDPVCLVHGLKYSEHQCLFCCLCFKSLVLEECALDAEGNKEDVCVPCSDEEKKRMIELKNETLH